MKIQRLFLYLTIMILSLNLVSCQSDTNENELNNDQDVIKIGILIYRFDDQFIQYVMEEIKKEKLLLDALNSKQIVVDFVDGNNQEDLQFDQIEDLIEKDYDALAVNLVDRSDAARVIELAKNADIPIVFFNREPIQVDMARWDKIYYVGSKGEDAGRIQGEIIADYWNKHPEVDKNDDGVLQYIMLEGQAGHQDAILRTENSIKVLIEKGIQVKELVTDTANWQRQEAKEKMMNYLEVFVGEIEFIISNNDMMALGAIDAMKESGMDLEQFIPIVGVDAIDDALIALNKGEMVGTVFNDSYKQGKMVMQIAYYLAIDEDPNDFISDIVNGKYYRVEYLKVTQ